MALTSVFTNLNAKKTQELYTTGNASDAKKGQAVKGHLETVVKIRWYMQIKLSLIRHGFAILQVCMLNWTIEIHFKCNKH